MWALAPAQRISPRTLLPLAGLSTRLPMLDGLWDLSVPLEFYSSNGIPRQRLSPR
jgi:hypothetical protein